MNPIPSHVAIIMDGNGRWAKERGLPRIKGHEEGGERVREIIRTAGEMGVKYLTLYAFSTENWNRPKLEVDFLMGLLSRSLDREVENLNKNNVQFQVIGDLGQLSDTIQKKIKSLAEVTSKNTGLVLTLALSYSSRREIVQAVQKIASEVKSGRLAVEEIDDTTIQRSLYTSEMPDPDLMIRTSGEFRISNFLLWQLSYTEIYVTNIFWPDFKKEEFLKAIENYQGRERRFGLA